MKFLIWILLGYLVYRWLKGKPAAEIVKKEERATDTHQDPVCGVYVSEREAVVGTMEGKRIYFCSMGCLERFAKKQQQG